MYFLYKNECSGNTMYSHMKMEKSDIETIPEMWGKGDK
jgi:hypothetical protein